jgi:peptidoglycan/LPS O-acetylase OafA/YrhL
VKTLELAFGETTASHCYTFNRAGYLEAIMLGNFLRMIRDPENRKALGWLGGGLMTLAAGAWVLITYFFPSGAPPSQTPKAPAAVQATGGSIASGRDTKIGGGVNLGEGAGAERE